eukprot:COSAG04_NODE_347_length_16110_cov_62.362411_12_plen_263_part_00
MDPEDQPGAEGQRWRDNYKGGGVGRVGPGRERVRWPGVFTSTHTTRMAVAKDAHALKLEANALFKAGRFEEARERYTSGLGACVAEVVGGAIRTTEETKAQLFANRAACHLKLGDHAATIEDCGAAIELKPLYVSALLRRATALEAVGQSTRAGQDLRLVLQCEPDNAKAMKALERAGGGSSGGGSGGGGSGGGASSAAAVADSSPSPAPKASSFDESKLLKEGEWDDWERLMKEDEGADDEKLMEQVLERQMQEMRASLKD